jgi:signal transduction histidine kinase
MKKQSVILFYVLVVYIILQFGWWGYHLIELTEELKQNPNETAKRVIMIIGEGLVFFVILLLGIWRVRVAFRKELRLSQQQNNFLLSVTHELKTPLTSNKLYLQTLLKHQLSEEKKHELITRAILENERLEKMIDNILNASRLESKAIYPVKTETAISALIEKRCQHTKSIYPKVQLSMILPNGISAYVDPFFVETIVGNLLENAVKYAGTTANIEVKLTEEIHQLSLCVQDDGPGVSEEDAKRIFAKFYRSGNEETRSKKGTGLGLFIASEMARLHGGKLSFQNREPKGTAFKLILPK